MKTLISIVLLSASIVGYSQDKPILITPQWLNEHKQDPNLVILHVGFLQLDYEKEHIAGARYLWPGWLAPDSPQGSMNMPDPNAATTLLQGWGVNNDSHIVICHARNEVTPSARMFLMLENLGLKGHVSFLNGGLEAWKKEGYVVTKDIPTVKKGTFTVKPGSLVVDKNYVLKTIDSNNGVVVDARAKNWYDGDPTGNPRDGHIKNAKNIPYQDMIDQTTYTFKTVDQLGGFFTPVVPEKNKEVVTYCFIGQTASVIYMTGRILGYDMKLYDGSMQEWSRIEELPMEKNK